MPFCPSKFMSNSWNKLSVDCVQAVIRAFGITVVSESLKTKLVRLFSIPGRIASIGCYASYVRNMIRYKVLLLLEFN